ncbi:NAD-dependent epimerase/dehydratase family protein [Aromatoleum toluvorans]|uniref:NAD-dependent epimerase/dehydratase family protein n=1 Tax=Aromatoleum toluvorans TaxID=92002 RepID=A0ABX1Q2U8_9RHOO|nr:SDR family oxidoreductase [Aromatoleum toluvorans]NMG46037.1 NAD-dependent epimerase/dehydratase family protein [Aromatoleum toluvorans]
MSAVLVTGASGFVGGAVAGRLAAKGGRLRLALRSRTAVPPDGVEIFIHGDLGEHVDWVTALAGIEAVVHCAARVHVMADTVTDPLAEFRRCNVTATLQLARAAAEAGVRRFIFISSIKVNGERTNLGSPYTADDTFAPIDPYGISKLEAERGLFALAAETGMEVVVIRPVLVYGPGVKANFRSMMNWLSKGIPLPFGAIHNKRSLVALDNLVDLIVTCVDHPAAANEVFLVSDGEDLSTTELLRRMGRALGQPARLLPVSAAFLEAAARLLGKRSISQRLCGSLQVDISKTRKLLGWAPPVTVDEALAKTAKHFLECRAR